MKKSPFLIFLLVLHTALFAQPSARMTASDYIQLYKEDAIKDMYKMGVPASITLAQGILESESGNSDLAREARNHFGIKCHKEWTGETFHKDDDEKDECFRKYKTVLESYVDHGRFLRDRPRYAFLFEYEINDYRSWAHGLKKAGYATNPRYAEMLIKLIEDHNLQQYDSGGKNIPVSIPDPVASAASAKPVQPQPKISAETRSKHTASNGVLYNIHDVPYVIASKEDTWFSIAMAQDMRLWQILKYNDASQNDIVTPGSVVYLKPKRGRPSREFHIVAGNESLWDISQQYGVKLKQLIKVNELESGVALQKGQKILLH